MLPRNDKRTDSEIVVSGLKAEEVQFSLGLDITIVKRIQQLSFLLSLTERVQESKKKAAKKHLQSGIQIRCGEKTNSSVNLPRFRSTGMFL